MKLHVLKNPNATTRAEVREVADDAPVPSFPWEEMTVAELEGWRDAQPPIEANIVIPVPPSVTRAQLFLWLYSALGITRAQIRAMITDEPGLIAFDEAQEFRRDHPLVAQLAGALGLTSAQVDDGFRAASQL